MTGHLTVGAQPVTPEPARRAPAPSALVESRPRLPAQPNPARAATLHAVRSTDADRLEASRLKALVTDPGVRISMHPDEASGRIVLQVVSRATGDVVEQIPAEELLRLYSALREPLLDERA
jgi:hypothetical protein